ncbi:ABC transporter ATP-binding protein [Nitratidesulfovibrio termitidis]|uniref:ABC transporter ATP-binding protein n=1 Tax=Nitratidesulfovibrio termitidis TaxID=42252 RepID=UPI00041E6EA4|nr:ABC transporter ATP-binding protein [Nitratidesulfovibrio termitidis]
MSLEAYAIYKNYGEVEALHNVDLVTRRGEFFTLLGPSGCGKTTLLRIVAGLELPDSGTVMLTGSNVTTLPANERNVNTVFQSYALFPHLTLFENVAFGMRSRRMTGAVVTEKVMAALAMVHMEDKKDRLPSQLSGGQKQRVALARALVNEPEVLLLDEPMSALDAKLRHAVQAELRQLQQKLGKTFILVTHDQEEALTVSDRIAVMRQGRVVQCAPARELYERPVNRYVADFLGKANIIAGRRAEGGVETELGLLRLDTPPEWTQGELAIRPENIVFHPERPAVNGLRARVTEAFYRGDRMEVWLEPGNLRMSAAPRRGIAKGDEIWIELLPGALVPLHE